MLSGRNQKYLSIFLPIELLVSFYDGSDSLPINRTLRYRRVINKIFQRMTYHPELSAQVKDQRWNETVCASIRWGRCKWTYTLGRPKWNEDDQSSRVERKIWVERKAGRQSGICERILIGCPPRRTLKISHSCFGTKRRGWNFWKNFSMFKRGGDANLFTKVSLFDYVTSETHHRRHSVGHNLSMSH